MKPTLWEMNKSHKINVSTPIQLIKENSYNILKKGAQHSKQR